MNDLVLPPFWSRKCEKAQRAAGMADRRRVADSRGVITGPLGSASGPQTSSAPASSPGNVVSTDDGEGDGVPASILGVGELGMTPSPSIPWVFLYAFAPLRELLLPTGAAHG